ncbi:MAG TPA: hypothetical protein VN625_09540, partial [Desulfuromonadaceae bacterium]|nr:hypothetical protein [Desulfuromonadaceae bacterium]
MLISVRLVIVSICCFSFVAQGAVYMAIDSLSGPITTNEIASFKNYMATQVPPETPWGDLNGTGHNAWCDFWGGTDLEAMSMMYEATGDIAILNKLVSWVDVCVSQRNDLLPASMGGQRVGWDGVIDKTWVPENLSGTPMAGCEPGDTAAHIAYCIKLILQHPSIWNTTIPDGNPYGYGVTYLARAKTYLAKCDEANDDYLVKWFVVPGSNLIRDPSDSRWKGQSVAINRQAMFFRGFARLAECHELLGDSPSRVAQYDAIANAAVNECLSGMEHAQIVNSDTVYTWGYYPWSTTFNESTGHAQYDVFGIYAAFNRKGNVYGISRAEVNPIAETLIDLIDLGNGHYAGNVDGTGTSTSYITDGWLTVADWDPRAYDTGAAADLASTRYRTTPSMEATILWMKNRRYQQFSVDASPASQTVTSGSSKTFTVTLAPLGGFAGTVNFSASGLPTGATATFNHSAVNLATIPSATTNVTVTIATGASTPAGSYTITLTGTSGTVSHSDAVTLVVANYTVDVLPVSQTVVAGNDATYTATVGSVNGFGGTVSFSVNGLPAGATASFSPSSVSGSGSSTLTVVTASSTPAGTNTLTITGTSGVLSHSDTATLIVTPAVVASLNLALNKTATASSTWSSSYSAAMALDGSDASRWSAASGQTNNQWVLID